MEESDFMGCDFTNASFRKVFSKKNNWEKAFLDDDDLKYLTTLEQIIRLIEQGKIDIRSLSKDDLLGLDIRRLDFSKVDLEDLDLSMFALDGINLCGTYIDPKQLMSLEGWNSYCLDVRKTKDMTRERLARKIMIDKEEDLRQYVNNQKKTTEPVKTKNLKRPQIKKKETENERAWGIEKARKEFVQNHLRNKTPKEKMEKAERLLFEKYLKQYNLEPKQERPQNGQELSRDNQPAFGIPVTPQNIQVLTNELTSNTAESTFIPHKRIVSPDERDGLSSQTSGDLAIRQQPENRLKDKENTPSIETVSPNSEKETTPQEKAPIKIEPKLIVSHEKSEVENIQIAQANHEEVERRKKAIETEIAQRPTEQITPAPVKTNYPFFNEPPQIEEEIEELPPKKSESDDEETIHDLTSAGYTMEEITELLRLKGPVKVVGKAPKGRAARHKTKG